MTIRPEFFIDESDINKEYFASFAIIISTLITEKKTQGQLTTWANYTRSPLPLIDLESMPKIPQCIWEISVFAVYRLAPVRSLGCPSRGGERGGSVVECRTPEREVRGSTPTSAVLCPWARHFTPRKYWLITQKAMAPSRHDWKIVDWDVKPQHNQPTLPGEGGKCSLVPLK